MVSSSEQPSDHGKTDRARPPPMQIAMLLATLTEEQRKILRLRLINKLTADETAQAIGTTPEAVRIIQHQALNRLRRELDE
jgi:RNA polymerase sigma-70 factor, ECF subfamily